MLGKKGDNLLFACIEQNIGDDLFIKIVCERYPERTFWISKCAEYGSLTQVHNLKFSCLMEKWLRFDSVSSENKIKKAIARVLTAIIGLLIGVHDNGIYIVGNAFKNLGYEGPKQLDWLRHRMALSEHFYILSTNFGPYSDQRWRDDAEDVFSRADDICFRDQKSFKLFSSLPNVRYAPDAVLSIGPRVCKEAEKNDQPLMVVSVIDCSFRARPAWVKEMTEKYESKMCELIDYWSDNGWSVLILDSNKLQDQPCAKRIKEACRNSVDIIDYTGDLSTVFELFEKADYVVATRLHPIILSWLYKVPVMSIIYDEKIKTMLESYDCLQGAIHLSRIEELNVETVLTNHIRQIPESMVLASEKQFLMLDKKVKNE